MSKENKRLSKVKAQTLSKCYVQLIGGRRPSSKTLKPTYQEITENLWEKEKEIPQGRWLMHLPYPNSSSSPTQFDFQDAPASHDHLKWSTNLPLFHRDETTTTGCQLIERVKDAANIATWDDLHKVGELASIHWGQAQSWWDSLETFGTDKASWDTIKTSFLYSFKQKHSAINHLH